VPGELDVHRQEGDLRGGGVAEAAAACGNLRLYTSGGVRLELPFTLTVVQHRDHE